MEFEIEEESMFAARKITFKCYTMVEILVVLAIMGILLGIAVGGINGMLKRQGASGAVRNISSKLSLARSYAVMKNSYVALLMPNDNPAPPGPSFAFTTDFTSGDLDRDKALKHSLFYTSSKLCIVKLNAVTGFYDFVSWIDGNEWESLPSGTCAYISNFPTKVTNLPISYGGGSYTVTSSAFVFMPNGTLVGSSSVIITAFMGRYIDNNLVYETKSGQSKAWAITVNPFTGRSSYEKKSY